MMVCRIHEVSSQKTVARGDPEESLQIMPEADLFKERPALGTARFRREVGRKRFTPLRWVAEEATLIVLLKGVAFLLNGGRLSS